MTKITTLIIAMLFSVSAFSKTITLTNQNTMSLNGPVDGESMTALMVQLQELNKIETSEPIYLVLNSPGGSIYDGFDFIRFAQTSKRPIHTVTLFAASMAFQIVEALGNRYVTSYSTLMSHKAKGSMGNLEFPGQLDSRYSHILSHLVEQDKHVVARTNGKQTLESYANLIQNEYWANSSKAINDGFADEEVSVACDKSIEGSTSRTVNLGMFSVNVKFSNCPLITAPLAVEVASGRRYVEDNNLNVTNEFNKLFQMKNVKF